MKTNGFLKKLFLLFMYILPALKVSWFTFLDPMKLEVSDDRCSLTYKCSDQQKLKETECSVCTYVLSLVLFVMPQKRRKYSYLVVEFDHKSRCFPGFSAGSLNSERHTQVLMNDFCYSQIFQLSARKWFRESLTADSNSIPFIFLQKKNQCLCFLCRLHVILSTMTGKKKKGSQNICSKFCWMLTAGSDAFRVWPCAMLSCLRNALYIKHKNCRKSFGCLHMDIFQKTNVVQVSYIRAIFLPFTPWHETAWYILLHFNDIQRSHTVICFMWMLVGLQW